MTSEEFDQLVTRIQSRYAGRPGALRWKILMLLGLGYAGFLAVLLIVLGLVAGLCVLPVMVNELSIPVMAVVAVLLAFALAYVMVFLWVPLEPQKVCEITRDDAPELFNLLDILQKGLRVAPFTRVGLTSEFNASVQLVPRLGVFGFNRTYLNLGLPLMRVLTLQQFTAVLAHEFAHVSGKHDRFGARIYQLRQTWSRVYSELHDPDRKGTLQSLRRLVMWFIDWYWPRFNAHAFVLSRADEYEADRVSSDWVGSTAATEALFRINVLAIRLNDSFWESIQREARFEEEVPDDILDRQLQFLSDAPDPTDAKRWLAQSAQTLTSNSNTHPSLADRLKSLGQSIEQLETHGFPRLPSQSAADNLLAGCQSRYSRELSLQWQKDNTLPWKSVFHNARRLEKQLESPPAPESEAAGDAIADAASMSFDVEQAWQQARTVFELQGPIVAEPILRELLSHRPTHSLANLMLGRHLLERGLAEGEQYLRRVIDEDDSELVSHACQGLIAYFQQNGQSDQVREIRQELSRFEAAQQAASAERTMVTPADTFVSHGLTSSELQALKAEFADIPSLAAAWLVRKELRHFKKQRLFVLVAHSAPSGLFGSISPEKDRVLVSILINKIKLPGRMLVVAPSGGFRKLARKIMSHRDARIV